MKKESKLISVCGEDVPSEKAAFIAISYIKGIGSSLARKLLKLKKLDPEKRLSEYSFEELTAIESAIRSEKILIGKEYLRDKDEDISRLERIGSYVGLRHKQKLPVRGQRTHSNSSTRRKFKIQ